MDYKAERQLREAQRLLDEKPEVETHTRIDVGMDEHTAKMIDHIILEARLAIEERVEETDEWFGEIECPACGKQLSYSKVKCDRNFG